MKKKKWMYIVWLLILLIVDFVIILPLIDKYRDKLYKQSLKETEIDYDAMGPEIVRKETKDSQNEG